MVPVWPGWQCEVMQFCQLATRQRAFRRGGRFRVKNAGGASCACAIRVTEIHTANAGHARNILLLSFEPKYRNSFVYQQTPKQPPSHRCSTEPFNVNPTMEGLAVAASGRYLSVHRGLAASVHHIYFNRNCCSVLCTTARSPVQETPCLLGFHPGGSNGSQVN